MRNAQDVVRRHFGRGRDARAGFTRSPTAENDSRLRDAERRLLTTAKAAVFCGFKTAGALRKAAMEGRVATARRRGGRGTQMWEVHALERFLRGDAPAILKVARSNNTAPSWWPTKRSRRPPGCRGYQRHWRTPQGRRAGHAVAAPADARLELVRDDALSASPAYSSSAHDDGRRRPDASPLFDGAASVQCDGRDAEEDQHRQGALAQSAQA